MIHLREKLIDEIRHSIKTVLHELAMFIPNIQLKRIFYRLRGSNIGKNVDIANFVFLEDIFPELITIQDNVDLGPNVVIVTHDSSYHCNHSEHPIKTAEVIIGKNAYIGAGAIILPGVHIGEHSVIGAGAVVTKDIPAFCVAFGVPAKIHCTLEEWEKNDEVT